MRWKYWPEKQSISWSLRLEATCWQRHQARQAFRTMCCRKPTSSFTPKFKWLSVRSWYHTQGRTKRQPWQVNHMERARAGVPPTTLQTNGRRDWMRDKTPTKCTANKTSRCRTPPQSAARSQMEAARMRRLPTWTLLHNCLQSVRVGETCKPTIRNTRKSKSATSSHISLKRHANTSQQPESNFARGDPTSFLCE